MKRAPHRRRETRRCRKERNRQLRTARDILMEKLNADPSRAPYHRNEVIEPFTVDFLCGELNHIIQVEDCDDCASCGVSMKKDFWLHTLGYRVSHIAADLVLADPELAAALIVWSRENDEGMGPLPCSCIHDYAAADS